MWRFNVWTLELYLDRTFQEIAKEKGRLAD